MTNPRPNPYPGPRAFQRGEKLYGRQRETAELLDLLIAERIVLFSSPSGAGKTSLVQAALIPELEREGFRVLPVMRPGLVAEDVAQLGGLRHNRYLLSLLLGLEQERPEAEQIPLAELAAETLSGYLDRFPAAAGEGWHGDVLVFDQFEEILTVDPTDQEAKLAFFEQVGSALRDRSRWALFSMREEYVAALDPYLRPIPARFDKGRRYRLDLLGPEAAREAMQGAAVDQDPPVAFTDAAAGKLADDLRRTQVQQPDGTMTLSLGQFIEPVQLQVVCRRLWNGLAADDLTIDVDDLEVVGDVDAALAGYYADTVRAIAEETGVRERAIREWFDHQLITEGGIRGQVLMDAETSQGLANAAIWPLVDAHLVRAEQRRGVTWFELAHDRLIVPMRADNAAWFADNLSTLQRQAALWEEKKLSDGLLLHGSALTEAEVWEEEHRAELEPHERAFLARCREARAQLEREGQQNRRIRILAVAAVVVALVAFIAAFFGITGQLQADRAQKTAISNAEEARRQATVAVSEKERALTAEKNAVAQADRARAAEAEAAHQKATAEVASTLAIAAADREVTARNTALAWARSVDSLQATLNAERSATRPAATRSASLPILTYTPLPPLASTPTADLSGFATAQVATAFVKMVQATQTSIAATAPFRIAGATSLRGLTDRMISRYGTASGSASNIFVDYIGTQAGLEAFCAASSTVDIVMVTGSYQAIVSGYYESQCLVYGRDLVGFQVGIRPQDAAQDRPKDEPLSLYTDKETLRNRPRVASFLRYYLENANDVIGEFLPNEYRSTSGDVLGEALRLLESLTR